MNIVSIDFDIIMAPSIEFYNNLVSYEDLFDNELMRICNADLIHYSRLTVWLLKEINRLTDNDIIFIKSHDSIIKCLEQNPNITLFNIDHHHDLGYTGETDEPINCGNWAKYLLNNHLIKNYIWINNENSVSPKHYKEKYGMETLKSFNLDNLEADKIIICLSPEWVPPQYRHLFFLWMDIVQETYGIKTKLIENT